MRKCKWMKFSGRKGDWFSSQNPRCAARMSHPFLTGVCLGLLFAGTQADAVTNNVSSITALQSAISAASSNDVLILADGTYTNFTLTVSKSGITVRPATPGGAYLNDVQSIGITGNNITFSGFQFTSRTISTNGIIITVDGSRNLLTQLNFDGYQAEKYINLTSSGRSNEVSYCNFKNKPVTAQQGNLIHVALTAGSPGYHKIRYNSFQDMPGKGGDNGNECIRLENGSQSAFVGRTVVEFNYFNNTGMGDSEVISVKCRENVLRYNTMTNNQQGNFCFRNGDSNIAYGNFFINSGGIRVKEANDTYCYNNYFEKCGDGIVSAPVKYVYYTVNTTNVLRNINFFHNTFVGGTSIDFDAGATNNTWANNIFSNTSANIFTGSASGLNWAGNQYSGTLGISIPSGMTKTNSLLVRNSDGYYGLSSNSPAIDAASTNYPAILDIANVDDDPSLLLDISGQARLASAILKDVGCDEYGVNSTSNHPLALSDVGPSYRVSLSAPVSGASFAVPTSIAMTANVVASTGTITTVGFYNGSTLLGSDTTAPYTYTWTNVAVGSNNLTARATDKSGAVSTSAVVAVTVWAPPPGDNFDLSHWKLQLPISNGLLTGASGKVDEIEAADLVAGYTSDYFYTAANGAMALYAPNNGACTSGSDNPRSELREQLNPPANNSWSVYGTHIMTATLKVTQVSPDTGKVCIGQMKGGYKVDGSSATGTEHMIMFDLNSQKIYANINPDGDLNHSFSTNFITGSGVAVSNTITYTMSMVDGLLKFVVNNVTNSCDLLSGIEYHPGVFATNWDRASGNALYFKAGSYNQATNGLADQGARVEFSSLTTYHSANITNQPDSVTNAVGSEAGFTVGASGNGTLGYQWRFNGTNISGKTSATLTLNNVATNNAGNYTVVVSDNTSSFSAITSAVATLTVLTNTSTGVYFAVPGVTNWTCPSNVVSVQVECWGGGGAGGSASRPATTTQYGGGGAGGAYARYDSYPVTPGNTYYINVGAGGTNNSSSNNTTVAGGSSWFNTNNAPSTIIIAKGGAGGESAVGSTTNTGYGLGGIGTSDGSAGDVVWAGGSGASGAVNSAGGGGSSAGTATNGTSATNYVGATAPAGGGNGGTGSTGTSSLSGGKGSPFGGAGAGALANSATLRAGGTGSVGRVVLTFSTNTFNAAPSVTLTAPTNNASFTAPASIALTANAVDTDGTITSVDFYSGATLIGSATNFPYAFTWTNVAAGSYSLTAWAADNDGAISTSAVATVAVNAVYALTVNSGSGGGLYTNGAQVMIAADAPASGKIFDRWIGDTQVVNNVTYTNTLVSMPAQAVALTATYKSAFATLIDVNFETNTVGLQPIGQGAVFSPSVNTTTNHIVVIGSPTNTAGTGNGVEYLDDTAASTKFEYGIPAQSAIRFDFSFSPLRTNGAGGVFIAAAVATAGGTGASANRFCTQRLYDNGTVGFYAGFSPSLVGSSISVVTGTSYEVSFFVNDSTGAVTYTDPNGITNNILAADSVAYWMNGTNYGGGLLQGGGTGISAGTNGLVLVGFGSTTTALGLQYALDDIRVSQILQEGGDTAYALTVNGGFGSGSYTNGQQVEIAANAPASGKVFNQWTGDTQYVNNVTYTNALVTISGNAVELTATYTDATYILTVTGGSGSGTYTNGQQVTITPDAPAVGKAFSQWIGDTQYVASVSLASTTVTMPAQAIALTATYVDVYYLLTANGAAGGTVSPASTNVVFGGSANFVITASNYYRIATLTTNGTAVTGASFDNNSTTTNFIWSNVQTSSVLAATFTNQVTTTGAAPVPYVWLAGYGLTNYNTDASADQDLDGLTAWQEYIAGTDPTNAASCFKAAQTTRNVITWIAQSNRIYSVYWSTNLVKGFANLQDNITLPQSSYTNTTPDGRVNLYQIKVRLP